MTWTQVRTRLAPLPCKSHGVAVMQGLVEGRLQPVAALFGGMVARSADMTSDLYLLQLGACVVHLPPIRLASGRVLLGAACPVFM